MVLRSRRCVLLKGEAKISPAIDLLPVLFPSPATALPLHQRLLFQSVSPFCFPGGLFVCRWFCWRCCSFMIGLNASRRGKKVARVGSSPFRITRGRRFSLFYFFASVRFVVLVMATRNLGPGPKVPRSALSHVRVLV